MLRGKFFDHDYRNEAAMSRWGMNHLGRAQRQGESSIAE